MNGLEAERLVVICGASIFLLAVEARLAEMEGVEVLRYDPHLPGVETRILAACPQAVILEFPQPLNSLALRLLASGIPVIELHPGESTARVMTSREFGLAEITELVQFIVRPHIVENPPEKSSH